MSLGSKITRTVFILVKEDNVVAVLALNYLPQGDISKESVCGGGKNEETIRQHPDSTSLAKGLVSETVKGLLEVIYVRIGYSLIRQSPDL
jgi:hypothetical protein